MPTDRRGLPVATDSDEAARHLDATVQSYLGFRSDTGDHLKRALAADPQFPLALCTRGYFLKLFCTPPFETRARQALAAAQAAAARPLSAREQAHIGALARWCDGDLEGACAAWDAVLIDHPLDVLAAKLAHYAHFYLHGGPAMRDSLARMLFAWGPDVPGRGFVLALYAFALEECGDYRPAEELGREAIALDPTDIWAAHAVAHVMEMEGRHRDGIAWIEDLQAGWSACNNFAYHVWWHLALFQLELGAHDAVLDLYDRRVRADRSDDHLDIVNATALLWRLEEEGVAVGERWRELGERLENRTDDAILAFDDAHYMLALAADRREAAMDRLLASIERAADRNDSQAGVYRAIGRPLCAAIRAARCGDHARAVDLLLPARPALWRLGGSHAQRDVFERMLISSALACGRFAVARALAAERNLRRANSRWGGQAFARAAAGLAGAAAR